MMKIIQGNGQDISVFIKSHQDDMKSYLESPGAILLRDFHCPTNVEVDNLSRDLGKANLTKKGRLREN